MRSIILAFVFCVAIPQSVLAAVDVTTWKAAYAAYQEGRFEEAFELLIPLARKGHVKAQDRLSHMYWFGDGTPVDYKMAAKWSFRSADQGSRAGAHDLGIYYSTGNGLPFDEEKALDWMQLALERGDTHAYGALFNNYAKGSGVPQDEKRALKYLWIAADNGMPAAQEHLGYLLLLGSSDDTFPSDRDPETAIRYLQLAAGQWRIGAQLLLATAYTFGIGIEADPAQGAKWAVLALEGGACPSADAILDTAANLAGLEATATAIAEARTWALDNPRGLHLHDEGRRALICSEDRPIST